MHDDDCLMFVDEIESFGDLAQGLMWLAGFRSQTLMLHPSWKRLDDPAAFLAWTDATLLEWDFAHLCTAHNGNCFHVAKEKVVELMRAPRDKYGYF